MVKRKSKRISPPERKGKGHATIKSDESVYGVPVPVSLHEAIENERGTLGKAASILRCLAISLEYDDMPSEEGPHYPDVADIACMLVRQACNGLDSVTLKSRVMRDRGRLRHARRQTPERVSVTPASPNTAGGHTTSTMSGEDHGSR